MRNYEIMFIVNPTVEDPDIDKINEQMSTIVTGGGGTIKKIEKMGKRHLAYPVKKFQDGSYVLFELLANGQIVKEFERRLRVIDPVIKYVSVNMDEELRRLDKIKRFRGKRATRRSSTRRAPAGPSAEEATS